MILYLKCLCRSREKELAKEYQAKGYEVRITKNYTIYEEAKQYGLRVPFVVDEKGARCV